MTQNFCSNCGSGLSEGMYFCPECGMNLEEGVRSEDDYESPSAEETSSEVAAASRTVSRQPRRSQKRSTMYLLTSSLIVLTLAFFGTGLYIENRMLLNASSLTFVLSFITMYLDLQSLDGKLWGSRPIAWIIAAVLLYIFAAPWYIYQRWQWVGGTSTDQAYRESPHQDQPTKHQYEWTTARKASIVGSIGAAVGAFLPWFSLNVLGTSATRRGIEADGIITLIAAVLVFIVVAWRWGPWQRGVSFVFGLFILGLGSIYIYDPLFGVRDQLTAQQEQYQHLISPDIGLYLTAIGGLVIVGSIAYDTWFSGD